MSKYRASSGRIPSTLRLEDLEAVIFDMDGVVTNTAAFHAAAWKRLFDGYLEERSRRTGEPLVQSHRHSLAGEHSGSSRQQPAS